MIAACLLAVTSLAQAGEPFEVTVLSYSEELPLGVLFRLSVEARNVSGNPVTVMFGDPPFFLEVVDDAGKSVTQCEELVDLFQRAAKPSEVPPSWSSRRELLMCVNAPGEYRARVLMRSSWVEPGASEGSRHAWKGTVASRTVGFRVVEPRGVDRQAYEAFNGNPMPIVDRSGTRGELLRRFSGSTYAAYVVWEYGAKGIALMPVESLISYVAGGTELLGNSVPDASGSWRSYTGEAFLNWRDGWFDVILKNHPGIWLAGELRFTAALDRYLLGDKDACAVGLEELADHGKPYVAAKAGELLSAMRAKGMLPEKGK